MTDAAARIEPDTTQWISVADGVELHVRRWTGGNERAIVLVHGLASNARLWDGVAVELAADGHPVVAVDQRGHGLSSKPDDGYDMTTISDDLRALVVETGYERPVVAGQSWGGNVVVELAARFPGLTAGIVCVDGGTIELADDYDDFDDCWADKAPPILEGLAVERLERSIRSMHPDWPESGIAGTLAFAEVRTDGTVAPRLTRERHRLVLHGLWEHRPSERWADVEEPVLFLLADTPGAEEWTRSKRRAAERAMAALGGRARIEWMVGDHDLHAQFPGPVARLLHDFAASTDEETT